MSYSVLRERPISLGVRRPLLALVTAATAPLRLLLVATLLASSAGPARAQVGTVQIPENNPPEAPIQLGSLYVQPSFELKNVGVDGNVFNDDKQESDFTATPSARLLNTLIAGRLRMTGVVNSDYVWYETFKSERSVNNLVDLRVEGFFDRYRPWVVGSLLRSRERQGYEIDTRARRTEPTVQAGLDWVVGSRTALAFSSRFEEKRFDESEEFEKANLSQQLNHRTVATAAGFRFELTPLTMLLVDAEYEEATFDGTSTRDNTGWSVMPMLRFQPDAYISGEIMVGVKTLKPKNPALVGFEGFVARGNITLSLLDLTELTVELERNTEYSLDELHPYFVQTGGRITVIQQIGGPFDVRVTGGRYALSYRDLPDPVLGPRGNERLTLGALGVGYRLTDSIRLGLTGQVESRRSLSRPNRDYDRTVYYGSLSYLL